MLDTWLTWQTLKDDVIAEVGPRLDAQARQLLGSSPEAVRGASPSFYEHHILIELVSEGSGSSQRVFGLHGGDATRWLDGSSAPIHDTNAAESLELTEEKVHDYVRFFLYFVRGDAGGFVLIESPDEIVASSDDQDVTDVRSRVTPPRTRGTDESGRWLVDCSLAYDDALFAATLALAADGNIEMTDDEPIASLEGLSIPEYAPLRPAGAEPLASTGDREVTEAIVAVLLEDAIRDRDSDSAVGGGLLRHFNAETGGETPIARFARLVAGSVPVVIIESDIPFVEEFVAGLIDGRDEAPASSPQLFSVYGGRVIDDAERTAHELSIGETPALLGCDRRNDVPEPLRRIADLVLTFPRIDRGRFARIFERVFGATPAQGWDSPGTDWTRYLVPADFHTPRRLGLPPGEAVPFMRERVEARLRQVTPDVGPGLQELQGMGEARQICEDVLTDVQAALDGRIPWSAIDKGLLLVGAPGTGKTTLARALARECGIKFVVGSAAGWQAAGSLDSHILAMRADFGEARRYAPSILFIDELDSVGNREKFAGQNLSYNTAVVDALLEQIQGIDTADPVIVIGATNYADNVDPALRRAGRLDQVIAIPLPNIGALGEIFEYYLAPYRSRRELEDDVDAKALASLSLGLTGADAEFFVRGAARRARRAGRKITQDDLFAEVTRRPRHSDSAPRLGKEELRRVSVHEAGHTVARLTGGRRGEDITYVTVVPRLDGSLGFVASMPSDANVETRREVLESLETALAGRAAEEIVFGADDISTGAGGSSRSSDLAVATAMAEQLVCQSGLGSDGTLRWTERPSAPQDDQIAALLTESYTSIVARLERERPLLDRVTEILVETQELSGGELRRLLVARES
jgi:ATP-dependent Zn protease